MCHILTTAKFSNVPYYFPNLFMEEWRPSCFWGPEDTTQHRVFHFTKLFFLTFRKLMKKADPSTFSHSCKQCIYTGVYRTSVYSIIYTPLRAFVHTTPLYIPLIYSLCASYSFHVSYCNIDVSFRRSINKTALNKSHKKLILLHKEIHL